VYQDYDACVYYMERIEEGIGADPGKGR